MPENKTPLTIQRQKFSFLVFPEMSLKEILHFESDTFPWINHQVQNQGYRNHYLKLQSAE